MTQAVIPSYKPGAGYAPIKGQFSAAVNPASMATTVGSTLDVTIPATCKADIGDLVLAAPGISLQGLVYSAYVKTTGLITVSFQNVTGGTLDIASSTWNFLIIPQEAGALVA
jgi:hypothetical protein